MRQNTHLTIFPISGSKLVFLSICTHRKQIVSITLFCFVLYFVLSAIIFAFIMNACKLVSNSPWMPSAIAIC